jgi:hypothetical protein
MTRHVKTVNVYMPHKQDTEISQKEQLLIHGNGKKSHNHYQNHNSLQHTLKNPFLQRNTVSSPKTEST